MCSYSFNAACLYFVVRCTYYTLWHRSMLLPVKFVYINVCDGYRRRVCHDAFGISASKSVVVVLQYLYFIDQFIHSFKSSVCTIYVLLYFIKCLFSSSFMVLKLAPIFLEATLPRLYTSVGYTDGFGNKSASIHR